MMKYVPTRNITEDTSFPYDFSNWNYPEQVLRSHLYTAWWEEKVEDGERLSIIMDYDGFIEWYRSKGYEQTEDFTAEEYLPYHIGRTIDVVKEKIK